MKKKTFKSVILYLVALTAMFVLFLIPSLAGGEYAYKYSVKSYNATIEYLNDFYLKKHPDFALENSFGTPNDWEYIERVLDPIVKDCRTDRDKAAAIYKWIKENIKYKNGYSIPMPKEVCVTRSADCVGIAYLFQQFLRMCDVPTVVCFGWRGNTIVGIDWDYVNDPDEAGHAWILAYIDNKWTMYDPLFSYFEVTDKDIMIEWGFITLVEGVVPYYEKSDAKWFPVVSTFYDNGVFRSAYNGEFINFSQYIVDGGDINYISRSFTADTENTHHYFDEKRKGNDKEVLTDGFLGDWFEKGYKICHAQYNGIVTQSTVKKIDGEYYLFTRTGGLWHPTENLKEYYMYSDAIYVAEGERLPVAPLWLHLAEESGYTLEYKSVPSGIISVDKNTGVIHIANGKDTAVATVVIKAHRNGQEFFSEQTHVIVVSDKLKHDYYNDYHTYACTKMTPATSSSDGSITKKCTGCSRTLTYTVPKISSIKSKKSQYCHSMYGAVPFFEIKDSMGNELIFGMDYTVTCKNNSYLGTGTAEINFKGKYSGKVSRKYKITLPVPLIISYNWKPTSVFMGIDLSEIDSEEKITYYIYFYNSKKKKYVLKDKTKYRYQTFKNLKPGKTYKVRVKAVCKRKGKTYTSPYGYGEISTKPAKTTLKSLKTKKKKQATVSWKKVTGATYYQVQYSTSKNFKKAKKITVKKATSKTNEKLKSKKRYYVRVRACKVFDGNKLYGSWSSAKSVKIK